MDPMPILNATGRIFGELMPTAPYDQPPVHGYNKFGKIDGAVFMYEPESKLLTFHVDHSEIPGFHATFMFTRSKLCLARADPTTPVRIHGATGRIFGELAHQGPYTMEPPPKGFNKFGKIDSAFVSYEPVTKELIIRADHSEIPEFHLTLRCSYYELFEYMRTAFNNSCMDEDEKDA